MYNRLPEWMDLTPRARIAIEVLSIDARRTVLRMIERYLEPTEFRRSRLIKKLPGFDDLYALRVTASLRVLFRYDGIAIEILDVVRRDRLIRMYGDLS